jgi:acyl carrier protein
VPEVKNSPLPFAPIIRERVQTFIEETFLAASGLDEIQPDESLMENGIIDSTGILEFIDYLEETFDIDIQDEDLIPDNLDSIDKVVVFIGKKIT